MQSCTLVLVIFTAAFVSANLIFFGFLPLQAQKGPLIAAPLLNPPSPALLQGGDRFNSQKTLIAAAVHSENLKSGHSSCRDVHEYCPMWAQMGDCIKNAAWLLPNCQESCGVCRFLQYPKQNARRKLQLNSGDLMPTVGFGTAGLGDGTYDAVQTALAAGYRLLDSAQAREWYREDAVGQAISAGSVPRNDLFLTSKLHPRDFAQAASKVAGSLKDLNTDYLDLFLLHYPRCWGSLCHGSGNQTGDWQLAWRDLEDLVERGIVRSLGVSNFGLQDLAELVDFSRIRPSVVQANSDLFSANTLLQVFCATAGIQFQGYSTLGSQWALRGRGSNPVMREPAVWEIADANGRRPPQVALRWALQHGQAIVPRSANPTHILQNLDVFGNFSLSLAEMRALDALDGSLDSR